MTTEQFYANYEFTDEKVNDNMELTEDRVIEMLDAFYEYKTKQIRENFYCDDKTEYGLEKCNKQCNRCCQIHKEYSSFT